MIERDKRGWPVFKQYIKHQKQKVLGIFCHPDDEILFGWPIFQGDKYEKHLIICCSDKERNRPNRKKALQEVCKQENINLVYCLDEPNDFYALPTRRADYLLTDSVRNIEANLSKAIERIKPDFIFTHSPVGEYGHGSHRLLFEIVSQHPKVNKLIITDICQKSNHRSSEHLPEIMQKAYYNKLFTTNILRYSPTKYLNINFYNRCKAVYDKHNAWTWAKEPVRMSSLYLLER